MSWLGGVGHRLRELFTRSTLEHELDEELRDHLERELARQRGSGLPPDQTRHQARIRTGRLDGSGGGVVAEQPRLVNETFVQQQIGVLLGAHVHRDVLHQSIRRAVADIDPRVPIYSWRIWCSAPW